MATTVQITLDEEHVRALEEFRETYEPWSNRMIVEESMREFLARRKIAFPKVMGRVRRKKKGVGA